jgi:hypothetical protein
MLRQQTHPRTTAPSQIQSEIKALPDGSLHTRLKNFVEVMGLRIPESKSQIRSRL